MQFLRKNPRDGRYSFPRREMGHALFVFALKTEFGGDLSPPATVTQFFGKKYKTRSLRDVRGAAGSAACTLLVQQGFGGVTSVAAAFTRFQIN